MPAVSTSSTLRPSTSIGVSIASRVVPATSETITRSRPRKALTSEDLPTFGRPITARRTMSSSASASPRPRAAARRGGRAGRRCRGPGRRRPPAARRGRGRGSRARAPGRCGESILLAATTTGRSPRRRMSAISSSPGRMPALASTTSIATSASESAARAWSWIETASGSSSSRSTPPVSISVKRAPVPVGRELLAIARDPGRSCTTASRDCVRRLTSEDLPTFG